MIDKFAAARAGREGREGENPQEEEEADQPFEGEAKVDQVEAVKALEKNPPRREEEVEGGFED